MIRTRYTAVAMALHWIIAALIFTNLFLGWRMGSLKGLAKFELFQLHKSVGITVLLLSVCRLVWRLMNPPPPDQASLKPWERAAAKAVHWSFYAFMIVMPLSGWIAVSASPMNIPTLLYHAIPWPHFPGVHDLPAAARASVGQVSDTTHVTLAFGSVVLLALHIGAVIKHQFLDRHPVLGRMVPFARRVPHPEI